MSKKRWFLTILLIISALLLLALAGFVVWAQTPLGPMAEATAALESDDRVRVEGEPWLVFHPQDQLPTAGMIFYPGGRVDPRSYAPAARALAEAGYLAVIVPMPLNLAVFAPTAAADVIATYPDIETWVIGGHSLGGVMAAQFAGEQGGVVDGLVLWAAYPANDTLATAAGMSVTSIYATNDGLTTLEDIDASRANLPDDTRWVEIIGGNHAQFGWYGDQPGDGTATITREQQQEQVVAATADMLEQLVAQQGGR